MYNALEHETKSDTASIFPIPKCKRAHRLEIWTVDGRLIWMANYRSYAEAAKAAKDLGFLVA